MLGGLMVVELGRSRAAAYAGKVLVDAGAHVLTVGDEERDRSLPLAAWLYMDVGKQMLAASPARDRRLLEEILPGADVVVTDLGPDQLRSRGLAPEAVMAACPQTDYLTLSALGWAAASRPAGELSMQALSGLMHMVGDPEREPLTIPYGMASVQLGLHAATAVAGRANDRARHTGQTGTFIDIAGVEVMASYVRIYGAVARYYDVPLRRAGRRAPGSGGRYPFALFPCKDGFVAMIARSEREWTSFLAMMDNPVWAESSRYQDLYGIAIHYPDEVDALVAPWLEARTRDELLGLAQAHAVPMAPVRAIAEVADDVQLRSRGFFDRIRAPDGTVLDVPGRPWGAGPRIRTFRPPQFEQAVAALMST